jgi:hypothetical protein
MKKLLYLVTMVAIALPAFTSCGKKSNDIKCGTIYHLSVSQDLLDLCDIMVSYRGADSVIKTNKINDIEWKKMVMNKTDTFNDWIGYEIKLKPGVKLTKDAYEFILSYEILNFHEYAGGAPDDGAMDTIMARIVSSNQIESAIAELNSKGHPIISINHKIAQSEVVEGNFEDIDKFFMTYHGYSPSAQTDSLIKAAERNSANIDTLTVEKPIEVK